MFGLAEPDVETEADVGLGFTPPPSAVELGYVALPPYAGLPVLAYSFDGDSGFDLRAAIREAVTLWPGHRAVIPTGIKFVIPDGYEIQVRSRSGMAANNGVFVLNSPGTIDSKYRGEVKVILFNTSEIPFTVVRGQKIAQAVVAPVLCATLFQIEAPPPLHATERGERGFGSTG